jgi:cytochrome c peroxidase
MKKWYIGVALVLTVFLLAGSLPAAEKSSVEYGRKLFNDPTLGGSKNDSSCNTCHQDGKGLEKVAQNKDLVKMINGCITGPLEGEKIDGRSVDMRSLKMYVETLGAK